MLRHRFAAAAVGVLAALAPAAAWACPMCKDSIPSSDAQAPGGLPSGFNWSIYLMLASLMAVLAFVIHTIVRTVRADARQGFAIMPLQPGKAGEHL